MFAKFVTLAIATGSLTMASPTPSTPSTPPTEGEFNIDIFGTMGAGGTSYIAHAVPRLPDTFPSDKQLLIIATPEITNSVPGTKAFFTGEGNETLALNLDLTDDQDPQIQGVYDVVVPDVGMAEGFAAEVLGLTSGDDEGWGTANGKITHQLQAATSQNQFYLCNQEVNGETQLVLSFGSPFANGTAPAGCIPAGIFQGTFRN